MKAKRNRAVALIVFFVGMASPTVFSLATAIHLVTATAKTTHLVQGDRR